MRQPFAMCSLAETGGSCPSASPDCLTSTQAICCIEFEGVRISCLSCSSHNIAVQDPCAQANIVSPQHSFLASRHSSARKSESGLVYLQGLLPCVAPLLPHLAEDAWENLPWPVPTKSVFQAGWFHPSANWTSLAQVCHQNKNHTKERALLNPETSISIQKFRNVIPKPRNVWGQ